MYFPISVQFNTNLETVVFASLAARIAHVFGEKVTYTPDTNQYRGVFSDYLRRTPPNGGRVLVVLDGLDEAAGWEAGADLFPTVAPGHLRIFARTKRPQLLQAMQALLPIIAEQGGVPALRETARAIVDTAKWWP